MNFLAEAYLQGFTLKCQEKLASLERPDEDINPGLFEYATHDLPAEVQAYMYRRPDKRLALLMHAHGKVLAHKILPFQDAEKTSSALIGAGIGALSGGAIGALSDEEHRLRNALIGAGAGGLLGAGIGHLAGGSAPHSSGSSGGGSAAPAVENSATRNVAPAPVAPAAPAAPRTPAPRIQSNEDPLFAPRTPTPPIQSNEEPLFAVRNSVKSKVGPEAAAVLPQTVSAPVAPPKEEIVERLQEVIQPPPPPAPLPTGPVAGYNWAGEPVFASSKEEALKHISGWHDESVLAPFIEQHWDSLPVHEQTRSNLLARSSALADFRSQPFGHEKELAAMAAGRHGPLAKHIADTHLAERETPEFIWNYVIRRGSSALQSVDPAEGAKFVQAFRDPTTARQTALQYIDNIHSGQSPDWHANALNKLLMEAEHNPRIAPHELQVVNEVLPSYGPNAAVTWLRDPANATAFDHLRPQPTSNVDRALAAIQTAPPGSPFSVSPEAKAQGEAMYAKLLDNRSKQRGP